MTNKQALTKQTHMVGLAPVPVSPTSMIKPLCSQALPHSMAELAQCRLNFAAFFLSCRTFRAVSSLLQSGERLSGYLGRAKGSKPSGIVGTSTKGKRNPPFSFSGLCCFASLILTLLITGCSHVPKKQQIEIITGQGQAPISRSEVELVLRDGSNPLNRVDIEGGKEVKNIRGDSQKIRPFSKPFRLSFVAVTPDVILRRIQEFTSFQYVAPDEPLLSAAITLDVLIKSPEDIYAVVKALADASAMTVKWEGSRAYFSQVVGESGVSEQDGFLIVTGTVTPELGTILSERYGVGCSPEATITICVGTQKEIRKVEKFLKVVQKTQGNVVWRLVETENNPQLIVDALGVGQFVKVTALSERRFVIASTELRFVDMVRETIDDLEPQQCVIEVFQPLNMTPEESRSVLQNMLDGLCKEPTMTSAGMVYGVRGQYMTEAKGLLMRMDMARPIVALRMFVATEAASVRYGLEVTGVSLSIPQSLDGLTLGLLGSIGDDAGLRVFEVITDGQSNIDVTQTDRVEGEVIVTDGGSRVQGQETRTVGLTATFDGQVTKDGYAGRFTITDSVLDDEITRSSACGSYVRLSVGEIVKACQYSRVSASRRAQPIELTRAKSDEVFKVYVSAERHSVYQLDQFNAAMGPV